MIIVLGPGRSGTSTVARVLHEHLGINMGSRFRDPDDSNPKGFYEDLDFRNLNMNLLSGGRDGVKRLQNLIAKKQEPFGIKDPRICNLWQIYMEIVDESTKLIVATRDQAQTVTSMKRCYGWSESQSENIVLGRLHGISRLLAGRDALHIGFRCERSDEELINKISNFLR